MILINPQPETKPESTEIKKLRDAITGWSGYGWKNGEYIDDLEEYFAEINRDFLALDVKEKP